MPGAKNVSPALISIDGSVGIRVTSHPFCQQLIQRMRKPLVSTSANVSGQASPQSFGEIDSLIKSGVDYIADHRRAEEGRIAPSRILRIKSDGNIQVIRD